MAGEVNIAVGAAAVGTVVGAVVGDVFGTVFGAVCWCWCCRLVQFVGAVVGGVLVLIRWCGVLVMFFVGSWMLLQAEQRVIDAKDERLQALRLLEEQRLLNEQR